MKQIQKPQTWGGAIGRFLYVSHANLLHGIADVVQNSQYLPNSKLQKPLDTALCLSKITATRLRSRRLTWQQAVATDLAKMNMTHGTF